MFGEIVPEKILAKDINSGILNIKHTEYPGLGNNVLNLRLCRSVSECTEKCIQVHVS